MTDKNKPRINDDDFSQLVKQKLENHQIPLDDTIWDGIEKRLNVKPQKRRIAPYYWITGGVAAAIALLFLLRPVQDGIQFTPKTTDDFVESKTAVSAELTASDLADASNRVNSQSTPTDETAGIYSRKQPNRKRRADNNLNPDFSHPTREEKRESNKQQILESNRQTETAANSATAASNQTAGNQAIETENSNRLTEKIDKLPDLNDYPDIPDQSKRQKRKKQSMLLAAVFGTDGAYPKKDVDLPKSIPTMGRAPKNSLVNSDITDTYAGILSANDYSNAEHNPPLSAGITVEKPITERLSMESGLVYTYLRSVYRKNGSVELSGTLQHHYLGVPLNLRVKALKGENWNIYASVGGMVEKGLQSVYKQVVENPVQTRNTNVKSSIDGFQYSLNGALGIEFNLSNDLSLFVEPKVIYYMENNQPMSSRTEQPLNLGVNGGLRIEL
ncbi:MAG: outer membrane beta-barrel protein [Paludibacteraceae bacterium]